MSANTVAYNNMIENTIEGKAVLTNDIKLEIESRRGKEFMFPMLTKLIVKLYLFIYLFVYLILIYMCIGF